jgi:hypothetical protein
MILAQRRTNKLDGVGSRPYVAKSRENLLFSDQFILGSLGTFVWILPSIVFSATTIAVSASLQLSRDNGNGIYHFCGIRDDSYLSAKYCVRIRTHKYFSSK